MKSEPWAKFASDENNSNGEGKDNTSSKTGKTVKKLEIEKKARGKNHNFFTLSDKAAKNSKSKTEVATRTYKEIRNNDSLRGPTSNEVHNFVHI